MFHIIKAEKIKQCCGQQENAIIAFFHVHGVDIFAWLFKNATIFNIVSAYAPSLPSEKEEKDNFYETLDEALRTAP